MHVPLDYETLRFIWWLLTGLFLIGFGIMGGFDLGVAIWLPFMPRTEIERRILINTIGPAWMGSQVWLVLACGATFAAWPMLYTLTFSGFYLAILFILLALILRPIGYRLRTKAVNYKWRRRSDMCLFLGGLLPAVIFGLIIGNIIQGVPFYFDENLQPFYTGTFRGLLNPMGLWCAMLSVFMLGMYGAFFLNIKTEGHLQKRARHAARSFGLLTVVFFAIAGASLYFQSGYQLAADMARTGPSNPLYKTVSRDTHAWFANYLSHPWMLVAPIFGLCMPLMASLIQTHKPKVAFTMSALSITGIISTVGLSMYPFILPSSTHPSHSLTVWDSSSSELTLIIMLIPTLILFPIILAYTTWTYRALRGKVTKASIEKNDMAY